MAKKTKKKLVQIISHNKHILGLDEDGNVLLREVKYDPKKGKIIAKWIELPETVK